MKLDALNKKVSEKEIKKQLEFERLISNLSSRFIKLPAEEINSEIKYALKQVAEFFGVENCSIYRIFPEGKTIEIVDAYASKGRVPKDRMDTSHMYPYMSNRILKGIPVILSSINDLPEEASIDRESLSKMKVLSLLSIPIEDSGQIKYVISLASLTSAKEWNSSYVSRLQLIGEILVTEHKRAHTEVELKLKERAIETSISGIGITDLNGKVIYANDKIIKMWGYDSREEVVGKSVLNFFEEGSVIRVIEKLKKTGGVIGEDRGKRKDGSFFDVQYSANLLKDKTGEPKYMFGSYIDVTRQNREKEALKRTEFSHAEAQHIGKFGSWIWNIQTGKVEWSQELFKLFGLDPESVNPSKEAFLEFVHPEDRLVMQNQIKNLISSQKPFSQDHRIIMKDGSIRYVHSMGRLEVDKKYIPTHFYGIMQDITERKIVEEELKVKNFAISSALNAIGITDFEGKLIYANDSLVEMWGYESEDEIIGRYIYDFWEGENVKNLLEILKFQQKSFGEYSGKKKDGTIFDAQYSVNIIRDENGEPRYLLGSFIDITDLKAKRKALEESERSLAEAQRIAHLGNWEWDIISNKHKGSSEVFRIFGLDPEKVEMTREIFINCIHPDDRDRSSSAA